jgi:soluble lytic murein transglycosylase-like protein
MRRGVSIVCACVLMSVGMLTNAPTSRAMLLCKTGQAKTYSEMSPAEQVTYIERQSARVTAMLSEDGKPVKITADALVLVKRELDDYASRLDSTDARPWRESIRAVVDRGGRYAPGISRTFKAEGLPPVLGLYVAMVESEYNECLESPIGAKGVFQFLPQTGARYGLTPDDLCDEERSASAAARFFKDLRAEFGASGRGALLALLSYNQGERKVKADFGDGRDLFASLAKTPNAEGSRYVARFIAAAIVGENPADLGLAGQSLTAY